METQTIALALMLAALAFIIHAWTRMSRKIDSHDKLAEEFMKFDKSVLAAFDETTAKLKEMYSRIESLEKNRQSKNQ